MLFRSLDDRTQGQGVNPRPGSWGVVKVFASFVGMAPIDDPKICLLVVVDNPANGASRSLSAGPAAKEILENTLKYMLVKPK